MAAQLKFPAGVNTGSSSPTSLPVFVDILMMASHSEWVKIESQGSFELGYCWMCAGQESNAHQTCLYCGHFPCLCAGASSAHICFWCKVGGFSHLTKTPHIIEYPWVTILVERYLPSTMGVWKAAIALILIEGDDLPLYFQGPMSVNHLAVGM